MTDQSKFNGHNGFYYSFLIMYYDYGKKEPLCYLNFIRAYFQCCRSVTYWSHMNLFSAGAFVSVRYWEQTYEYKKTDIKKDSFENFKMRNILYCWDAKESQFISTPPAHHSHFCWWKILPNFAPSSLLNSHTMPHVWFCCTNGLLSIYCLWYSQKPYETT